MAIHLCGKYQYVLNILIHASFSLSLLIFLYIACLRIFLIFSNRSLPLLLHNSILRLPSWFAELLSSAWPALWHLSVTFNPGLHTAWMGHFSFFIGRIVIEIDQFMSVKKSRRKEPLEQHWTPGEESRQRLYRGSSYEVCASPDDVQVVMTAEENVTRKRLINYFRYIIKGLSYISPVFEISPYLLIFCKIFDVFIWEGGLAWFPRSRFFQPGSW